MGQGKEPRDEMQSILNLWLTRAQKSLPETVEVPKVQTNRTSSISEATKIELAQVEPIARYDFDLAEFPLFTLHKNSLSETSRQTLVYSDTVTGQDGIPVTRTWKTYPGPFGFGGSTTQVLLYDLLQLYCEQGARGSQIEFGTLRSLFQRHSNRNPSKTDYFRIRRDLDILRGYDFHCTNAFWDRKRGAYVDMKWRLFGAVFFFKSSPTDADQELPFGFIEVSPILQQIAKTRGFFSLGFGSQLFYQLKPLEQRLAIYLAKKFVSQKLHRRFVEDLAKALPIETANESNARKVLTRAAKGLLDANIPFLAAFRFEKSVTGKWLIVFDRKHAPKQLHDSYRGAVQELAPALLDQVERIIEAVDGDADRAWWIQCVKRLGPGAVDRCLGLLKEAKQTQTIRNPGGLLTRLFQKIADEYGVALN